MSTLREKLQDKLDQEIDSSDHPVLDRRVGFGAAIVVAALLAGLGFMIIRRRRRRSLLQRLQDAMPEVDDLRATLKRPLQRAVKAL